MTDSQQRTHTGAGKRSSATRRCSSRLRWRTHSPGTNLQPASPTACRTLRPRHGPSYLVPDGRSCTSCQQTNPHACTPELSPMWSWTEPNWQMRQLQTQCLQPVHLLPAQAIGGREVGQSREQGPNPEGTRGKRNDCARLELQPQREGCSQAVWEAGRSRIGVQEGSTARQEDLLSMPRIRWIGDFVPGWEAELSKVQPCAVHRLPSRPVSHTASSHKPRDQLPKC